MSKILTFGVYDYFHLGHLRLFKQCKQYGDYLIVAIQNSDYILKYKPDAKIMYSNEERVEMISALGKRCMKQGKFEMKMNLKNWFKRWDKYR